MLRSTVLGSNFYFINRNQGKYISKYRLNVIRVYSILYTNLLMKVFKTGILRKVAKIFTFFIEKRSFRDKIYYRIPFIFEMRDR